MAEMTARIKVGLYVDESTARAALNIVNLYLNDNDIELAKKIDDDGEVAYVFAERSNGNVRIFE